MVGSGSAEAKADPPELRFLGQPTWIKAGRALTGGNLSLIEQILAPGFESPWHVHHTEDESFYVLEGSMTVLVDGSSIRLQAGGFAFGPRGVPHGFRIEGETPARILAMTSGSDFSDFIAETSVSPETPPSPPDMAALVTAAARHGIDILGPLPR